MALPFINLTGNVVAPPELRFTNTGKAVCNFRVACNRKSKDENGQWVNTDTIFLNIHVWGGLGENTANELTKGQRVNVSGSLSQREWEKDGVKRFTYEVTATDVALPIDKFTQDEEPQSQGSFNAPVAESEPPF